MARQITLTKERIFKMAAIVDYWRMLNEVWIEKVKLSPDDKYVVNEAEIERSLDAGVKFQRGIFEKGKQEAEALAARSKELVQLIESNPDAEDAAKAANEIMRLLTGNDAFDGMKLTEQYLEEMNTQLSPETMAAKRRMMKATIDGFLAAFGEDVPTTSTTETSNGGANGTDAAPVEQHVQPAANG